MPSVFRSCTPVPTRVFSRAAGALVVLLGIISAAPAFAIVGEWSTPVNLSVAGEDASDPQVAVDGAGNAVAVWSGYDGSDDVVQSSGSSDGGVTWSTPVTLSAAGQDAYGAQVAGDTAGNAVAVWRRYDGSNDVVQSRGSSDGGVTWSTPVNLSVAGQDASDPQVAGDAAGNTVAVWSRYDGVVQSSGSSDGGVTWSTPVNLSVAGQDASSPQVAGDGAGNAVAVWYRYDGSNAVVQSSGSSDGGVTWSTPVNLSVAGQSALSPQVAVDGAGNAVAVWRRYDGSNDVVQSSGSSDGGVTWSTPVNLTAAGQDAYDPQVAVNDAGNPVAVWSGYDGSNAVVQSSGSSDGGVTWSTPVTLSVAGQSAWSPQVAVDGAGNAVAVWYRYDGSNDVVQSSGSSDGGVTWSTPATLSVAGQDAESQQVAVDGAGNAIAVWYRYDGSHNVVQSSGFDGGGSGGEELASTGAGGFVNNTALVASVGLLALGVLTRVFVRRRGVENGR